MSNDKTEFSEYKIQIGTDDLIESKVLPLIAEDPAEADVVISKAKKKLLEVLKETRVRMGTLLKTDNISFLIGAGASISAGGVSLANIPKPLEDALLAEAESEKTESGAPEWIHCFYETASLISRKSYSFDDRQAKYPMADGKETEAICITAMSLRTQRSMKHLQNLKNGHNYPKFLIGKLK